MSDKNQQSQDKVVAPGDIETRGAAEWIAAGSAGVTAALQAYQTFKPSDQDQPPTPQEQPEVILPPGTEQD